MIQPKTGWQPTSFLQIRSPLFMEKKSPITPAPTYKNGELFGWYPCVNDWHPSSNIGLGLHVYQGFLRCKDDELRMLQQLAVRRSVFFVGWLIDLWIVYIYTMGHQNPTFFRGFLMVNNLVFRWPTKTYIFPWVSSAHGIHIYRFSIGSILNPTVDGSEIPNNHLGWC